MLISTILGHRAPVSVSGLETFPQNKPAEETELTKEKMHHSGLDWSTLDHVSILQAIFVVVASELVALSCFFSSICPSELNNGVCSLYGGQWSEDNQGTLLETAGW